MRYHLEWFRAKVNRGWFFVVLRNPLKEFLDAWRTLRVANLLSKDQGRTVSLDMFLSRPTFFSQRATKLLSQRLDLDYCSRQLINRQACRLRGSLRGLKIPYIAEYWLESLTTLRYSLCWTVADVRGYNEDLLRASALQPSDLKGVSARQAEKILVLNRASKRLYDAANKTLWSRVLHRPRLREDMDSIRSAHDRLLAQCLVLGGADAASKAECAFMQSSTETETMGIFLQNMAEPPQTELMPTWPPTTAYPTPYLAS